MIGKYLLGGIAGAVSGLGAAIHNWISDDPAPAQAAITTAAQPAVRVLPVAAPPAAPRATVAAPARPGVRIFIVRCTAGSPLPPINLPDEPPAPARG
jgi:hypothetical protein